MSHFSSPLRQGRQPALRAARCGHTTVEFAFISPIVFLVTFAAVEFGRINMVRHTADNAAYSGARAGIIPGGTAQEAIDAATRVLRAAGVQNAVVTVTPPTLADTTTQLTVEVQVPLSGFTGLSLFSQGQTLTAATMLFTERAPAVASNARQSLAASTASSTSTTTTSTTTTSTTTTTTTSSAYYDD